MSDKPVSITTHDGTKLTIPSSAKRLVDLLPDPKTAAKEAVETGIDDRRVNDPWVRHGR